MIRTCASWMVILSVCLPLQAFAQCAGCGADFNKADRANTAKEAERQRLQRVDPPIQKDPLGNALIGGGITGVLKGSFAAGAAAAARGTAVRQTLQTIREKMRGR